MSERAIALWFIAGIPIVIIDAWLSVKALIAVILPDNPFVYVASIVGGICLTIFTVYAPILRGDFNPPLLISAWIAAFITDITTSIIGVIWYGVMSEPLSSSMHLAAIRYEPSNWMATSIYVAFALLIGFCCFRFGQALNALNQKVALKRQLGRAPHGGTGDRYQW